MRRWTMIIGASAVTAALGGCSAAANVKAAEAEIAAFHARLDRGDAAGLYADGARDLKAATAPARFTAFLQGARAKLGRFKAGKTVGWNDSHHSSGHFVTIAYSATYEKAAAQETFVYRLTDGRAKLAGYHVSSDAFVIEPRSPDKRAFIVPIQPAS